MAKFYGVVGFAVEKQGRPGVSIEEYVERPYYGDLMRNTRNLQTSGVNDDITISNQISIIADPYVSENFHAIRYVKYLGTAWKVTSVEVQYPRLILSVGGVYNV